MKKTNPASAGVFYKFNCFIDKYGQEDCKIPDDQLVHCEQDKDGKDVCVGRATYYDPPKGANTADGKTFDENGCRGGVLCGQTLCEKGESEKALHFTTENRKHPALASYPEWTACLWLLYGFPAPLTGCCISLYALT